MTDLNPTVARVTEQVIARSAATRATYLDRIQTAIELGPRRHRLACGNIAHGLAGASGSQKRVLRQVHAPSLAIVSAYNDMLSAHQPLGEFPDVIKRAAEAAGAVAQFAGGVPAMCDGVTQGQPGMELSLFSRDVIAMSTAVALSHDMFDGALCLGVCDKIVPGLLIGALSFGHLPTAFVPAGPMTTGLSNKEKSRLRVAYARGEIDKEEMLRGESQAYHGPGTCTFYGTANTNQMLMEIMGLHLPGASFVHPHDPLRAALTAAATRRLSQVTALGPAHRPLAHMLDERSFVNAIVGVLATGGSTNHTIHIAAIARAAGIIVTWDDFSTLSDAVPTITRMYPNGDADVNEFQAAGGMPFLIGELIDNGFLHSDVQTMFDDQGLAAYRLRPELADDGTARWVDGPGGTANDAVLVPVDRAYTSTGGLRVLDGNIGRAVIKVSAVPEDRHCIEAPALVFDDQERVVEAFDRGELERDFVAVVRFQGPRANGMPELHQLTPRLTSLQEKGYRVALVTDGRMSGASGRVPAAIHVSPECLADGPIGRIQDGDVIRLDATAGELTALVDPAEWAARGNVTSSEDHTHGCGRELFTTFRQNAGTAETGASIFFMDP